MLAETMHSAPKNDTNGRSPLLRAFHSPQYQASSAGCPLPIVPGSGGAAPGMLRGVPHPYPTRSSPMMRNGEGPPFVNGMLSPKPPLRLPGSSQGTHGVSGSGVAAARMLPRGDKLNGPVVCHGMPKLDEVAGIIEKTPVPSSCSVCNIPCQTGMPAGAGAAHHPYHPSAPSSTPPPRPPRSPQAQKWPHFPQEEQWSHFRQEQENFCVPQGQRSSQSPQEQHSPRLSQEQHSPRLPQEQHSPRLPQEQCSFPSPQEQHSPRLPQEQRSSQSPQEQHSPRLSQEQHSPRLPQEQCSFQSPQEQHSPRLPQEQHSSRSPQGQQQPPVPQLPNRLIIKSVARGPQPTCVDPIRRRDGRKIRDVERLQQQRDAALKEGRGLTGPPKHEKNEGEGHQRSPARGAEEPVRRIKTTVGSDTRWMHGLTDFRWVNSPEGSFAELDRSQPYKRQPRIITEQNRRRAPRRPHTADVNRHEAPTLMRALRNLFR